MKSFPERLIDIQNRKRLNDSELAEKGGIKPPSLSKILKGTTKDPGISFFSNLVSNLKLSPEETYLLITGKAYQSDEKSKDQRIAELEQRLQTAEELNKSLSNHNMATAVFDTYVQENESYRITFQMKCDHGRNRKCDPDEFSFKISKTVGKSVGGGVF